jgi:hypothetical protein
MRVVAGYVAMNLRLVGTREQIADRLAEWCAAGVDGINLLNAATPGTYDDFVDHVVPILRQRDLAQREYVRPTQLSSAGSLHRQMPHDPFSDDTAQCHDRDLSGRLLLVLGVLGEGLHHALP